MFSDYRWKYDPAVLAWCEQVAARLIGRHRHGWKRKGTWMERGKAHRRIALAPHKAGLSIYFTSRDGSPAMYQEMGGICRVGKCVIRVDFGRPYDAELLAFILNRYL